jgi:hypothetical protein
VGQFIEFLVSVGSHGRIREAIDNIDGKDVSVDRFDTLFPPSEFRAIVNVPLVVLELARRVDGFSMTMESILIQNCDYWALVRLNDCASRTDGDSGHFVIVNPRDVDHSVQTFPHGASIATCDSPISSSVD